MTGLTFTRLSARGEPRDVARILIETERARNAEEILVKMAKSVIDIIRAAPCVDSECVKRIRRVCETALLDIV